MAEASSQVARIAQRLAEAELRVSALREQLDAALFAGKQEGCSIAELSRTTGLSRETIYKAIKRYRARKPAA